MWLCDFEWLTLFLVLAFCSAEEKHFVQPGQPFSCDLISDPVNQAMRSTVKLALSSYVPVFCLQTFVLEFTLSFMQQDPAMVEQLSKNITRMGLTNYTLNFLRVSHNQHTCIHNCYSHS